jgi:NAD(P)-dependent dehydrogenase (short-subunit alcohol dehydrogenase family)
MMNEEHMSGTPRISRSGKVALVTGASSGLGAATAMTLADAGFDVAALDLRSPSEPPASRGPGTVTYSAVDVADARAVERAISEVMSIFQRIDVLVNCAGIDHTYWIEELSVEQFDQVIDVNLRGPFLMAKAVWPVMRRQGGGHIVNVASTAALRAWGGATAYHASKFGLLGLSRALGVEGRECGIDVTTIIPGGMRTHFFDRFSVQGIPLPPEENLQDPQHVAQTILFAVTMPQGSVVQEILVTAPLEMSWP